ncbi:MAG: response regulator [Micavibrio aeruginosavorus]|nr:response regulator [Micavibrio aeruginosavorus]
MDETGNVLESLTEAFVALDPEWRYIYVNAHAEKILRMPRAVLLGKSLWDSFPDISGSSFDMKCRRAMVERVSIRMEMFHKTIGVWLEINVFPLQCGGLGFAFHDISTRKRVDAIIEGQRQALELSVGGAPLENILNVIVRAVEAQSGHEALGAILLLDQDGGYLKYGAAPSLPAGYRKALESNAVGPGAGCCGMTARTGKITIANDIANDPRFSVWRNVALEHDIKSCWSTPIFSTGGKILGTFAIYYKKNRNPVPGDLEIVGYLTRTVAIIIEQKKQMLQRERAEYALKQADRRKDEFLAILAHELRNPLAPIGNAIHIMRSSAATPEMKAEARDMIERQTHQMARLVDDLMDVSRITRGKIALRKQRIRLDDAVGNAIETVRPLIEKSRHELQIHFAPEPLYVHADPTRIVQIFSNVLNNAAKYTTPGGQIWLSVEQIGGQAVIRIKDNGIGIPANKIGSIFDMFSQVENALDRAHGGLGIGLTLVKNMVAMHEGRIEARSDGEGKGSEFTIYLPLAKEDVNNLEEAEDNYDVSPAPGTRRHRILVVDDNEAAAKTIGWMLEMYDHDVRLAHNGPTAIEIAKSYLPDVVLLDIGLPGMNGYEICQAMKAMPEFKDAVFIAQTGWGQKEHRQRSHEAGFKYHLVKPVDAILLQNILTDMPEDV